jgi:hypothetical protein
MNNINVTETSALDIINHHPFAKPCMLTIFMHDYAIPARKRKLFPFISRKSQPLIAVEKYSVWTMDFIRTLSDEGLGRLVKETLISLEESKAKIEKG